MKTVTLLFLRQEGRLLLAMKKRAFGEGKWNGVGGKVKSGEPTETQEMRPKWFAADSLPYNTMWADSPLWLPYILAGQPFGGTITATHTEVIEHTIRPLKSLKEMP